jgi:hypothetical protein
MAGLARDGNYYVAFVHAIRLRPDVCSVKRQAAHAGSESRDVARTAALWKGPPRTGRPLKASCGLILVEIPAGISGELRDDSRRLLRNSEQRRPCRTDRQYANHPGRSLAVSTFWS